MPVFSFTPIADGADRTASVVNGVFSNNASPETTLDIVNGELDYDNAGGVMIGAEHTQRGSAIQGYQSARTTNLDFMWHLFGGVELADTTSTNIDDLGYAIPGAVRTWYQPWTGLALVTWQIFWGNDNGAQGSDNDDLWSSMFMLLDGTKVASQQRNCGQCMVDATDPQFYKKARVWTGHALVSASAGWRTAGLWLVADYHIRQTRVWSSSIRVLPFKSPA